MKSYGHYCGLARALDAVGDRWTLLIVRELLAGGPARYSDLQHGLPGIATNMLGNRLREMEAAGLVMRSESPPPTPATLYQLTPRGEALDQVIAALGQWSAPLMTAPHADDEMRAHWYALPIRFYFEDAHPLADPVTLGIRMRIADDQQPLRVEIGKGVVHARTGSIEDADAVITGRPDAVMAVLTGRMNLAMARRRGVGFSGNEAVLRRLRRRT